MKLRAVLKKIKADAKRQGTSYREVELTNHTGIIVGNTRSTIGRHAEVDEVTVKKFFDQFADEFGKGWWR